MKHFIVEIIYKTTIEKIEETRSEHRSYLKIGYDKGILLLSGVQVPKLGGIVIAREESMEKIVDYFNHDPYKLKGYAEYNFIEFQPVGHQDFLKEWIKE